MEITSAAAFVEYYKGLRQRTRRVVDCIPPEHIEWTHRAGRFTLGDLVRHLAATERYMFAETVQGGPSRYPGHGRELAEGLDAVRDYMDSRHAESLAVFSALDQQALQAPCQTPAGVSLPTWKWLRALCEHEVHHRGQIYVYLALLDVPTPPLYGLTEQQVRERSLA
jgi:uncharacterized damage-inducible protein DinB